MKNILWLLLLLVGVSCSKKDTNCETTVFRAPDSEVSVLEQYLKSKNIDADKDARGFFYKISSTGSGPHPTGCSNVTVNYKGWLTSGTVFDEAKNWSTNLDGLISGWQAGIPLLTKGETITLYLPPSLGYGSQAYNTIPGNSILIFSIDLVSVN